MGRTVRLSHRDTTDAHLTTPLAELCREDNVILCVVISAVYYSMLLYFDVEYIIILSITVIQVCWRGEILLQDP